MKIIISYDENKRPLKLLIPTTVFIKIIPYFYLDKHTKKYGIVISKKQIKLYLNEFFKNYKMQYKEQYKGWKLIEFSNNTGEKVEIIL